MYYILRKESIPENPRHIIWDVNGTITKGDTPDREVLQEIVALAKKDIHHSFITGRDRKWLQKFLISHLRQINGFEKTIANFHFYPELALINLDAVSGKAETTQLLKNHPLTDPSLRRKIASLFYQTGNLIPYQEEDKAGYFQGGDADGNLFLIPEAPQVQFPWFIWSDSKELMATIEVLRNPDGTVNKICAARINETKEKLESIFRNWQLEDIIKVSPVSTALNLVPIVDNRPLDKDIAAGIAVSNLSQYLEIGVYELLSQTIAIGDGTADLQFATPSLGLIPIFFVGPKSQLRPTVLQEKQVVLVAEGSIKEEGQVGSAVTREALKLIESNLYERRKAIYLRGKDSLQKFLGQERLSRGIQKRIRHATPENVEIHNAFLDPALQEGHLHTAGLEAIMLQKGSIDAIIWDEEKTEVFPLREWGDLIIFPPDCRHTLLVKEKSHISVVKNFSASPWKDRRKVAELPAGLEAIRQEVLEGEKSTKEALVAAERKL